MSAFINGWTKASTIAHIKANFKGKSYIDKNRSGCAYRGRDGAKCAAGLFIPDNLYVPGMEGIQIGVVCHQYPALYSHFPLNVSYIKELQIIHDEATEDTVLENMIKYIEALD